MDINQKLTPNFSLYEFTYGGTQMKGTNCKRFFTDEIIYDKLGDLKYLAEQMEKVRILLGNNPINVHCALRPYDWEIYRGRNGKSQHITGNAIDFSCPGFGSCYEIALKLSENKDELNYDQLIFEYSWIHIAFRKDRARKQDLTLAFNQGYKNGIHK